ncbi:MAG TPA: chemotaxis protein CheB, partial [Anaerovoracaceae bacterium]|nr:chemotaxis protein CheB [Anaerovoracaceae bacterium]
ITIAQKPDTAAQPDMPESAIESGCIDFILSPEDIAKEIKRIANPGKKKNRICSIITGQLFQNVPTPARGPGLTQTKLLAATAAKQLFLHTFIYSRFKFLEWIRTVLKIAKA